ncbi:transposase [Streptomyces violascens]|uniref:transposase n=1 Tax=Streptomyces violascens TaxID=67381 RepID=UPI0036646C2C
MFLLPAYSPDLNPVEGVWAHVKRSLANLAVMALGRLEVLVRNRLKRLQYRPEILDGFIAGTGLALDIPTSPRRAEVSNSRPAVDRANITNSISSVTTTPQGQPRPDRAGA